MRTRFFCISALIVIAGCAPYRQLKPKPEINPQELGYIELTNDKKDFELKKEKRYFFTFPKPQQDNFYLILSIPEKKKIGSFLTAQLVDNKKPGDKINDESPYPDTVCVYAVDTKSPLFYWLIDKVPQDMALKLNYRYAPQWRYKFETSHARFKATLKNNLVDRTLYMAIGVSTHLESFNYQLVIDTVAKHTAELEKVLDIESIFPSSILNSSDVAYQSYLALKKELEEEILFQKNYRAAIDLFAKEYQCRGNTLQFMDKIDEFITFFATKEQYPATIIQEAKTVIGRRLDEIQPAYEKRLAAKQDSKPLDAETFRLPALNKVAKLYESAGLSIGPEFPTLIQFTNEFDTKARANLAVRDSLGQIAKFVQDQPGMPGDNLFRTVSVRMEGLGSILPKPLDQRNGKYLSYPCAAALAKEIAQADGDLSNQTSQYIQAASLVPQLNILKGQGDYSGMLGILVQYRNLPFLIEKYKDLDKMSLSQQTGAIGDALNRLAWGQAESSLQRLHVDRNFLNPATMLPQKDLAVRDLEDSLYNRVETVTRSKVNRFCDSNLTVLDNVDSLYTDSVFLPAYNITFSSGSKQYLIERKNQLIADLAKMKENEFPARAIKLLYEQFSKNPDDNGVAKARAIVTHGDHYTGDDRDTKIRMAECNPHTAKWISKPTEYRRVFVLPITDNKRGKNKYRFRLNVNIPTEAAFPVYDVNIKLPKEVAQNAAAEQWYDEMSLNKNVLKNEGRFSISAPSASNDFECQITPVQMTKDKGNILDVQFTYNAFKVFIVSVMVQKPIIKKN
jgi:hypothetical protein